MVHVTGQRIHCIVQYEGGTLKPETWAACLCQPISWNMALSDSVVVVVVRTRPRAILLAIFTMRISMSVGLRLAALWAPEILCDKINYATNGYPCSEYSDCKKILLNQEAAGS